MHFSGHPLPPILSIFPFSIQFFKLNFHLKNKNILSRAVTDFFSKDCMWIESSFFWGSPQRISVMDTLFYLVKDADLFFPVTINPLLFISLSKGSHLLIVSGKALSNLFFGVKSIISLLSNAVSTNYIYFLLQKSTILFLH